MDKLINFTTHYALRLIVCLCALLLVNTAYAQSEEAEMPVEQTEEAVVVNQAEEVVVEELIVVGSHIRGNNISDALAVSVISAEDIEDLAVESGDELFQLIPENGQNFFNEAENISGGVNSARGDIGSFNLRNIGTGNTLVLLNGRRVVNAAGFQTEEVGGSFVPVNSANSNTLPVYGVDRVEVLRDGASAIYGADAVAGVINTVLKTDFVGLNIAVRRTEFDNVPRDDKSLRVEYGMNLSENTNLSVFFNYYTRDNINSQDDSRWANSDFRNRIGPESAWRNSSSTLNRFRNNSANSEFGQFDITSSVGSSHSLRANSIVDNLGEFEVYPAGDSRCTFVINLAACGAADGQGTVRHNLNANRDLSSDLTRFSAFAFLNHTLANGMELFSELSLYQSDTKLIRHASAAFSSVKLRVGPENYYNPLGKCGSPNRLPDNVIGTDVPCSGLTLDMDNFRFTEVPRIVDNSGESYRVLVGLRGELGEWAWEGAFLTSESKKEDITRNRVSNTLIAEALFDDTSAAYNPFSVGLFESNIERALVNVYRNSTAGLTMLDFKATHPELFVINGNSVGFAGGIELRRESFDDDRDPRLDGTIKFEDYQGDTFPYVSDVVNSSPTPDNDGSRSVTSLFAELQIPLRDNLDFQIALRHENFSDVDAATVGKLAVGYAPHEMLLFRGSFSQAFRAPNLVTINETLVSRQNTRTDYACQYAAETGGDPGQVTIDCDNSIQRTAQGSKELKPEKSENVSLGLVFQPHEVLTLTVDYWSIVKTDTIGLLGEENHTILELVDLINRGDAGDCEASSNPAVVRSTEAVDADVAAIYKAAGICALGDIQRIDDKYANLDERTLEGFDVGLYINVDTNSGRFNFKYNTSTLLKYEQKAGGDSAVLLQAAQSGAFGESTVTVDGFSDLVGRDGNQKYKHTIKASWRGEHFGTSMVWYRIGSFYQSANSLPDGRKFIVPRFDTFDLSFSYKTKVSKPSTTYRFGIKNVSNARAPLADRFFGYFADAHSDFGRSMYFDVKARIF